MAYIRIQDGQSEHGQLRLSGDMLVGRAPSSGLCLSDMRASRAHALIRQSGAGFQITDLGSSNGTYVNAHILHRSESAQLEDGDEIRIGSTRMVFCLGDPQDAADTAPGLHQIKGSRFPAGATRSILPDSELRDMPADAEGDAAPGRVGAPVSAPVDAPEGGQPTSLPMTVSERRISALAVVSRTAAAAQDASRLYKTALDEIAGCFPEASRIFLLLPDESSEELLPRMGRFPAQEGNTGVIYAFSRTVLQQMTRRKKAVLSPNARDQFGKSGSVFDLSICAMMCVPLMCEDEIMGAITVDSLSQTDTFDEDDLLFVQAVADQLAQAAARFRLKDKVQKIQKLLGRG